MDITSAPLISVPIPVESRAVRIDSSCVIHPFYIHKMDLDLSLCPDVFGLKAFDENMPITRMLPGSSPCKLRLLLPDTNIGKDGFHDVVVENLIGSSTWRSRHVSPSDVIALRRRWPIAVFHLMKEHSTELEDLRRQAYTGLQWAYRYAHPGYCPECKTRTDSSLESHMMCCHLGLGQLWRCPVEWCAVWKGSLRECRDHFNDKHSGSVTLDFEKVSRSFPAWTVTRKFWEQALNQEISGIAVDVRLFHESGRRLVHKYRVYQDPIPHPALREGRITKLLSFVNRAMVIAQLTHLRIAIPSSGTPPGEVRSDCSPKTTAPAVTKRPRRVTFSPVIQSTMEEIDLPFQWPQAEWEQKVDATLDPGLDFVASWSARIMEERSSTPPLIPLSPITAEDSQDSIVVQVGSPATGKYKPTGLDQIRSVHRRRPRRLMKGVTKCEKLAPAEDFLYKNILWAPAMGATRTLTESTRNKDHSQMNDRKPLFGS